MANSIQTPTPAAIDAEVARLKPRYEAFMQAQGEPVDEAQLRDWARENLIEQAILKAEAKAAGKDVDALLKSIAEAQPKVTIDEARAEFKAHPERYVAPERVHARHLVIHRGTMDPAEAVRTLLNLRTQIQSGTCTWDEAVARHSACPHNADLGFFPRGVMEQAFEDAAFAAEEDSITDVVETPLGWHLIHVVAHLPEEPMLFEEAREPLLASLQEARTRTAIETFLDERRAALKLTP